tara:strand:+ start:2937 stop:3359 length:423 start_codon:yes stop_codon:yes gene_type:complete
MRIYLSSSEPADKSYKWASNIVAFNDMVQTSEATSVVCDQFLSSFSYSEIPEVLKIIASKMRLQSQITIVHPDIVVLSQRMSREEVNEQNFNDILFRNEAIRSVCSTETIQSLIPDNLEITQGVFDVTTSNMVIKARRVR